MPSNDSAYLRLLPSVKGFENVAAALGLDLNNTSSRPCSKNLPTTSPRPPTPASGKIQTQLDTSGNFGSVSRFSWQKAIVLHDRVKRAIAGALFDSHTPENQCWESKPFNPRKIAKRLLSCQASWMVLRRINTEDISLLPVSCNTAPCPHCARTKSAILFHRAEEKFEKIASRVSLRWMTLDIVNPKFGELLRSLNKILTAFREIRQAHNAWSSWHQHVKGYIWSAEITINHVARSWHPHIHLIFDGSFFPMEKMNADWRRALGTTEARAIVGECYIKKDGKKIPLSAAPQTEIRYHPDTNDPILHDLRPENLLNVIAETTKYILAPLETEKTRPDQICELMFALHNKRLKGSGGTLQIPGREKKNDYINLGGLQSVLDPTHPKYVDDSAMFGKIVTYAQTKPLLWFNLLRFWPEAFWIEKADQAAQ